MRAVQRVLALGALAAPLVIGCAGLASAHEEPSAHYVHGDFVAGPAGAGEDFIGSFVSEHGVEHIAGAVFAGDEGVAGTGTDSGAQF
ncbi:hypothetical protein [Kitasatospora sp. NPDC004531]